MIGTTETERLVELLRAEPGFGRAELAGTPQPLTGGFWASMSLVRLANIAPLADTLVLRVMPDPALAAKETVFQREIARQGFPAPAVRLSGGADAGVGGAFILMDQAPGAPALAGLDPAPLQSALTDAGVAVPSDAPAFLASLTESADQLGRTDLRAAALWLAGHPPPSPRRVIAHGDLHPFNLLVDGERWTLLDWTSALIADPAYDLTFTTLMLRHPPLTAPTPLRPIITAAGAALAQRFYRAYRRHSGIVPDQQTQEWYTSLHALRILIELDGWRHDPARSGHSPHPWTAIGPVAASVLSQTTNTTLTPLTA
jgi:aminoglycoside phosphotransferase (APT) family kinase protein